MRTIIYCYVIFSIISHTTGGIVSPVNCADPLPQAKVEFANRRQAGRVTALTADSITIETPEYTHRTQELGPDRVARWVTKVIPAQPPTRFPVSRVLAAGQVPQFPRDTGRPGPSYQVQESFMYRLTDVKVGDWIVIIYARVDGVDTCDHIQIHKRPGGRVPPLPEGVEKPLVLPDNWPEGVRRPVRIPYHERMNAHWDLEDKGIPYPEKFGHMRRFPVAPPPRLVPEQKVSPPPR